MQAQPQISVRFAELDFLTANHVHGPESFDFVKTKFEAAASIKKRKKPDVAAAGQVMRGYLDDSYDDEEDNFVREFEEGAYLVRQCDKHHNSYNSTPNLAEKGHKNG